MLQPGVKRMLALGFDSPFPAEAVPGVELVRAQFRPDEWAGEKTPRLPFEDASFSLVAACDALDKLPAGAREPFVRELSRVSNGTLLVASPFDSPLVSSAEEALGEIHKSTFGQPHAGVALHRRLGLPRLDPTRIAMASAMGGTPIELPNTSLRSWTLFEMLGCVSRAMEHDGLVFTRLNRFYNARLARLDHCPPVYRTILLAAKGRPALTPEARRKLEERFAESPAESEIRTVRDLLRVMLDSLAETMAPPPAERTLSVTMRRVADLESRNRDQATTIEKLNNEISFLKSPQSERAQSGLLKRLFTF